MFLHPEDLYRLHQQQHPELIRNRALDRQARAAHQPSHRLREIGLHVSGLALSRRWWKAITAHFHRDSNQTGTPTSAPQRRTSVHHSTTSTLGAPACAPTEVAPVTTPRWRQNADA